VVLAQLAEDHREMRLQDRIGIRVREIRKARNLTQESLAELVGRSVDTISLLERGKIVPSLETLEALARGLGTPLRDLLDTDNASPKDAEMVALQTAAIQSIRQMKRPKLAVAVKQLQALADM
jgi:transcriptional regulator with XRE-family HTH domain